jgi:hypothetical protein
MDKDSHSMKSSRLLFLFLLASFTASWADDFFEIKRVRTYDSPPKNGNGVWDEKKEKGGKNRTFRPCIEVELKTAEQARADKTFLRVHFFSEEGTLLKTIAKPSVGERGDTSKKSRYSTPVLFPKDQWELIYFAIPDDLKGSKWKAVVVFGDKSGASAMTYPNTSLFPFNYPEKDLVEGKAGTKVERKAALDPVIQHVVKTGNPSQPQITLFLRPPDGVTDASEIKGVLAACVLANRADDIKMQLQARNPSEEVNGLMRFADKHKLAILCWGSQTLWNPGANYDELQLRKAQELDRAFDQVARAWERGVHDLHEKYGIPERNFFLWGTCASAQWAHRLAMRKPDYFLAVYIHLPSSFDRPTPEAAKILWMVTAGELDGGYDRSVQFYQSCREAGYSMVYKPIVGLGHAGSPIADMLGLKFFEFAMGMKDLRSQLDEELAKSELGKKMEITEPWLEQFRKPPLYGDFLNQQVFPAEKVQMIPAAFRVPLPTKEIADSWNR